MKTYRDSRLIGACFGLIMFVGFLALGVRPGVAQRSDATQAQDTTRMTLIFAVFPGQSGAKQAMDEMERAQKEKVEHLESYAVVSKDQKGNIKVQEKRGEIDGVVALLGRGPTGGPNDTATSAAGNPAGISKANADKIRNMLTTGNSAIMLLVPASHVGDMHSMMEQAHAKQVLDAKLLPKP
jgi:uncharacterized membrane protein